MTSVKSLLFGDDVQEGKVIFKETISMAWPSMLESFLVNMTGFFDTIMVSSLGISAVAAVGLTAQPKFIGICVFFALSTAISSLVARRLGEKDRESANRVLRMSILVAIILITVISIVFVAFADQIIRFSGSKPDTHQDAVDYLRIIMGGLFFTAMTLVINAAQRGAGKTRISMVTNISSNLVNVVFNYLLIGGNFGFPEMGIRGAAIATVIGSVVSFVLSVISILHKDGFVYIGAVKGIIASKKDIKSALSVGSSAFVEQIFLRIGFFLFALTVANLGTVAFGANQIGMTFISLSFAIADGLAVASVALVGRSLGQLNPKRAKQYTNTCLKIGIFCAFIISMIFFFFGRPLFALFDSDPVVLDYGDMIMKVLCFVIYAQIVQVTIMASLRGAGDTKYTAYISLISVAIVRPLSSWFLCEPMGLGLFGIWMGLCCDQVLRLVLSYIRFQRGKWLQIKL